MNLYPLTKPYWWTSARLATECVATGTATRAGIWNPVGISEPGRRRRRRQRCYRHTGWSRVGRSFTGGHTRNRIAGDDIGAGNGSTAGSSRSSNSAAVRATSSSGGAAASSCAAGGGNVRAANLAAYVSARAATHHPPHTPSRHPLLQAIPQHLPHSSVGPQQVLLLQLQRLRR